MREARRATAMNPGLQIETIERLHWALLAATVIAALFLPGASAISVAAGGLFMGANVSILKHLLRRLLRPRGPRLGPAMALLLAKMCLFLGLLVLLFRRIPIDGLSFAGGATVFLLASVIGVLLPVGTAEGES